MPITAFVVAILITVALAYQLADALHEKRGRLGVVKILLISFVVYATGIIAKVIFHTSNGSTLSLLSVIPILASTTALCFDATFRKFKNKIMAATAGVACFALTFYGLIFGLLNTFGE